MEGTKSRAKLRSSGLTGAPVLDLHGFSEEDALHELRRFVDLHRGGKAAIVRIITGRGVHGEAVIRPAVHAWLARTSAVAAWRLGLPAEGGEGVVIVQLRRRGAR
jgi:DNA-nicking Smr family endonuclease